MSNTTYFTTDEINQIITECAERTKGHRRHPLRKKYTLYVDGGMIEIGTTKRLRNILGDCLRPNNVRVFRNFDKGATIDLDTHKTSILSTK